jgi:hypothetical protein
LFPIIVKNFFIHGFSWWSNVGLDIEKISFSEIGLSQPAGVRTGERVSKSPLTLFRYEAEELRNSERIFQMSFFCSFNWLLIDQ